MYSKEKLLELITSERTSDRYEAVEWIRISPNTYPEYIYALDKATHDPDPEVARRACLALETEVHHQMAIKLGVVQSAQNVPPESETSSAESLAVEPLVPAADPLAPMFKDIRSWAWWSISLGFLQLLPLQMQNASWGILLIIVGLASFLFKTYSMYILYAVVLSWAAITNIIWASAVWKLLGLFQIYLVVRVIQNFIKYRKVEAEYAAETASPLMDKPTSDRAARLFPWLGSAFGIISMVGYIVFFFIVVYLSATERSSFSNPILIFIESFLVNLGILGLALGLASFLSKYRPTALGIIAVIAGALTVLIEYGLVIIGVLAG